jgi:hypothetical protein
MTFIKLEIHGNAFENCKRLSMNFQNFGNAFPKTKRIEHTKKGIHHTKKEQNTQKKKF